MGVDEAISTDHSLCESGVSALPGSLIRNEEVEDKRSIK